MSNLKHLTGGGTATTQATAEAALALLADVESYPRWFGSVVKHATKLQDPSADGPGLADIALEVAIGPIKRSFDFRIEIHRDAPETVRLRRIPSDGSDRETFTIAWTVSPGPPTAIEARLDAHLDVPPFLPAAAVGNTLAASLVRSAAGELDKG